MRPSMDTRSTTRARLDALRKDWLLAVLNRRDVINDYRIAAYTALGSPARHPSDEERRRILDAERAAQEAWTAYLQALEQTGAEE